ncbi:hypothetical protein [Mangrovimonas spongiae]|uniref:Uncharacterized protein n=1 Tax=Mangrovimonas spongiae TaxID=2494697 RepID=A0A3R9MET3_9FLAO|nr:hypothetical protein [Mangrovimonas spongiae]RSK40418.1 hypothetical protein EJA19_05410 [Mangrovimonas spongiae]
MTTNITYRSYNTDKTLEELQYNINKHKIRLENTKEEIVFYEFILSAPMYKNSIINLFETLQQFKTKLQELERQVLQLIEDINVHVNQIAKKNECEDVMCDNYFLQHQDNLERKTHDFFTELSILKSAMFDYLKSVIKV